MSDSPSTLATRVAVHLGIDDAATASTSVPASAFQPAAVFSVPTASGRVLLGCSQAFYDELGPDAATAAEQLLLAAVDGTAQGPTVRDDQAWAQLDSAASLSVSGSPAVAVGVLSSAHTAAAADYDEVRNRLRGLFQVPIAVTAQIGSRTMTVRDLTSVQIGDTLELDRQNGMPVLLVANGVPFAIGEPVTIDGDFGVRIIEIISDPAELS